MLKEKFLKKILITEAIVVLLMTIIFAIVAIWNWSFIIGFVIGAIISTIAFLINILTAKRLFKNMKNKKKVLILGFFRIFIQLFWYILWVFVVVKIDLFFSDDCLINSGINALKYPINFFTFIIGISIVTISIFITNFLSFIVKKNKIGE